MKFLSDIDTAARIKNVPAGTIAATTVQGAINELDDTIQALSASATAATKTGTASFPGGGTTDVVTDAFITVDTFVVVSPTGTKVGSWTVEAAAGSFTVTSDATEAATATYDWGAFLDGTAASGGTVWGDITGTLTDQTDLVNYIAGDRAIASVELTSKASNPAAPTTDKMVIFGKNHAGRMTLNGIGPSGIDIAFQPALFGASVIMWMPGTGTTTAIGFGTTWTARNTTGAQAHPVKATTNLLTQMNRATFSSTSAVNTGAGIQSSATVAVRGNAAGIGGFFFFARFGIETLSGTGQQVLVGLSALNAVLSGEPSVQNNTVGIGKDAADTTWQLIFRETVTTKVDTGLTIAAGDVLDLYMFCKPNDTKITIRVVRVNDGSVVINNVEYSTNLPGNTTFLYAEARLRNTGTVINALALNRIYVETDV